MPVPRYVRSAAAPALLYPRGRRRGRVGADPNAGPGGGGAGPGGGGAGPPGRRRASPRRRSPPPPCRRAPAMSRPGTTCRVTPPRSSRDGARPPAPMAAPAAGVSTVRVLAPLPEPGEGTHAPGRPADPRRGRGRQATRAAIGVIRPPRGPGLERRLWGVVSSVAPGHEARSLLRSGRLFPRAWVSGRHITSRQAIACPYSSPNLLRRVGPMHPSLPWQRPCGALRATTLLTRD